MPRKVVVFGSLNMDFVVRVPALPKPGETTLGSDFQMIPGGKGANQACAVGRLGEWSVRASMVGRVGDDVFADRLKGNLAAALVDVSGVETAVSTPSGVAFIWVDAAGQNSIVVAPGANDTLTPEHIAGYHSTFADAQFALFQLETPLPAVAAALKLVQQSGAKTILDPAPARKLAPDVLASVDILTPNESEACLLLGIPPDAIRPEDAASVARRLRHLGCRAVVIKLGRSGCFYSDAERELHSPAFSVNAIDTTAAGDVFNAGFAVAMTEQRSLEESLQFANGAAALSTTRLGAQSSVPMRSEVDAFLKSCAS